MDISKKSFVFFSILEKDLQLKIPYYIKNILNVRGFNNAFVFKSIQADDVEKMQEYVRVKLEKLLKSHLKDEEFEEISCNFFGAYSNRTNEFEFNAGEERLIEQMAEYVKIRIDTQQEGSNFAHFQNIEHLNMKKIRYWANELIETPLGLIYGRENVFENGKRKKAELKKSKKLDINSLKENLFQATLRTLNKHIIQNEHFEAESKKLSENCVVVRIDETMAVKGEIICPFCDEKSEIRVVKPYFQFLNGSGYWILSNYASHLKKYHNSTMESEASNEGSSNSSINQGHDYSTISLKIEPIDTSRSGLDDRNQQLEDDLYTQMSFQNLKIMNTVLGNKEDIKSFSVGSKLKNTSASQIKICEIAADNSCMYGAIAHQLFFAKLGSLEHAKLKRELRQSTVKYINENFSNFTIILKDRVYEIKKKNLITDMEEECRLFVNNRLANPECWGRTESLKAISEMHKVNIIIVNHDGTCNSTQPFSSKYTRTIAIFFRHLPVLDQSPSMQQNNHYDSVVCMDKITIHGFAKSLMDADLKKGKFLQNMKDCQVLVID